MHEHDCNISNPKSICFKCFMSDGETFQHIPTSPFQDIPSFSSSPPRYLPLLARPRWHVVVVAAAARVSRRWGYALLPGSCRPVGVRNLVPNLVAALVMTSFWGSHVEHDEKNATQTKMKSIWKVSMESVEQCHVYSWEFWRYLDYREEECTILKLVLAPGFHI